MILLLGAMAAGCGGEDYKYEEENPDPPDVVYAEDVRMYLRDMKEAADTEGPGAIDFEGYFENMKGYGDDPPVGEHKATYDKIQAGVKELQEMAKSGNKGDVAAKLDELLALTDKLPKSKKAAEAK
jgi:hypothetical protein